MKIGYGIVTVNRPGNFIYQTIRSLEASGFFLHPENLPLRLYVGTTDAAYLARYAANPNFAIVPIPKSQMDLFKFDEITRGARCSLGHYWAMLNLLEIPGVEGAAVFEDDVRFARGWQTRLYRAVRDVPKKAGQDWIMSLYLSDFEVRHHRKIGNLWFEVQKEKFFGSQAIYYPRPVLEDFLPILRETILLGKQATDMAVANYTRSVRPGTKLLTITPCLVQHIGNISVGCNPHAINFHQAGCFEDVISNP